MIKITDIKGKTPQKSREITDEYLIVRITDFLINHSLFNHKSSIHLTLEETRAYSSRILEKIRWENKVKISEKVIEEAIDKLDNISYISWYNSNPITIIKSTIKEICGNLDYFTATKLVEMRIKEKLKNEDPVLGYSLYYNCINNE